MGRQVTHLAVETSFETRLDLFQGLAGLPHAATPRRCQQISAPNGNFATVWD